MPERGWSILIVRESTAKMVKELAKAKGLTIDELINHLISSSVSLEWSVCSICRANVKTKTSINTRSKYIPKLRRKKPLTSQTQTKT